MTSDNIKSGVYLAAIAAAGYVVYQAYKKAGAIGADAKKAWGSVKDGAATVGGWVNPASSENLAYQGINKAGKAWTGTQDWNLGGAIYDAVNPEPSAGIGTETVYDAMGNVIGTTRNGVYPAASGSNGIKESERASWD